MKRNLTTAFLVILLLGGCFPHIEADRQMSDVAYIRFTSLASPAEVHLATEGKTLHSFKITTDASTRYGIPAGSWRLTVVRDGASIMDRNIFIAAGEMRSFDVR